MFTRDPYTMQGQTITKEGQALVQAENHTESRHHSGIGNVFSITTDFIATGALALTYYPILYFENISQTKVIHIGLLRVGSDAAVRVQTLKNPTAMSNGTAIVPLNMNFSAGRTLDAMVEYGGSASVFTGGSLVTPNLLPAGAAGTVNVNGSLILGPGDVLGMGMAPIAAAVANVFVSLECWQIEPGA